MRLGIPLAVVLALSFPQHVQAQQASSADIDALRQKGARVRAITPIFSQLVMLSLPAGFKGAYANATADTFIQELVPTGETVQQWTQMLTLTGNKGLATRPDLTPQAYIGKIAEGFQAACPTSFSAIKLGAMKLQGYDNFVGVVSCGTAGPGASHSESTLFITIKGEKDYYTIQWAERAAASPTPLVFEEAKWLDRVKQLAPLRLCPIVPGEKAPYPSCIEGKP